MTIDQSPMTRRLETHNLKPATCNLWLITPFHITLCVLSGYKECPLHHTIGSGCFGGWVVREEPKMRYPISSRKKA